MKIQLSPTPSNSLLLSLTFSAALAGCAGRSPQPVQVAQPQDQASSCAMLAAEAEANNAKIADLAGDQNAKVAQNVAAVAAGILFTPLLFFADFQGTAGIEIEALRERQRYLGVLSEQKHCEVQQYG